MSKIESILHTAHYEGIYHETMSIAQEIKQENPKMEVDDRYEMAYSIAKRKYLKN
jgi:hypothetical protein